MKKYSFLFRPAFFIFCLLFSSWTVLKIEKLTPGNFGKYSTFFEKNEATNAVQQKTRASASAGKKKAHKARSELKNLFSAYKAGLIDSVMLDRELERLFADNEKE